MTENKKIILIGDKDALNTGILMACITDMGLANQVVYAANECFS